MSGDELETKVRDHDEAIRNLERIGDETVAALRSLHKRLSASQEYALRDNRLTADDLKETLKEAAALQARTCSNHETRIKAVEDSTAELDKSFAKAENNIWWLDRWVLALSSAFCAYFGWDIYMGVKK